jgi:hypothetical protein
MAWTQLFGEVGSELFVQLKGAVQDADASFDFAVVATVEFVGFLSS